MAFSSALSLFLLITTIVKALMPVAANIATISIECSLMLFPMLAVTSEYGIETHVIQKLLGERSIFEDAIILSSPNGAM